MVLICVRVRLGLVRCMMCVVSLCRMYFPVMALLVVYRVYSFKGIIRYLGGGGSPFGFGAEEAVTGVVISMFLIVSVIEVIA